eukprot:7213068-Pyramimonas_sp.AAC.1
MGSAASALHTRYEKRIASSSPHKKFRRRHRCHRRRRRHRRRRDGRHRRRRRRRRRGSLDAVGSRAHMRPCLRGPPLARKSSPES